ncbi:MAG TPA: cellulose binding domain-containing protein, partial [Propionicimonas sp.]|nr:cellulose binding domain-containing protein [Propionicimonas sp.]
TQSSGALALYVDGAAAGTATGSTVVLNANPTLTFGRASSGIHPYAGSIDEIAVYNTVLSGATVSGHYQSGANAADTSGPTGGSVNATGLVGTGSGYAASTTLSIAFATGIDPSGVATAGNLLKRASTTLASGGTANGTCGAFGSYTTVSGGTDPVPPKSDTVTDQSCYSYQYVVLDTLGNATTYTSPDIKVDLTAPAAPTLAHSAFTNTYWSSGSVVYYRSAAASGSFTVMSTATDTASGIASHTFPTLGTNWTSTPGVLGVNTYSWSGAPAVPGAKSITATNNATGVSGGTSFTPTADDTAPGAGTVTPPNAAQASTTVSVAYTTGTDGGSGVGTRLLQRQSATLTGTTCGSYGGWTTAATNPASSPFSDTVAGGFCYKYQYVVADNVGNADTATSGNVVQVTPSGATLKAQYKNNEPAAPINNSIQPHLQLVNTGASGVDLGTITVRYWFTKEAGSSTFAAPCYYATVGCGNVTTSVVAVTPRTGADSYLLVGFTSSALAAGDSSQVQLGLSKDDWSNFDEVDDYSYGTGTSYADSTKVTVYQGGTLIWGTEP